MSRANRSINKIGALLLAGTISSVVPAQSAQVPVRRLSSQAQTLAQAPASEPATDEATANGRPEASKEQEAILAKQVDQLVFTEMSALNVPGYALAVIKDGDLIVKKGYGFADLESRRPVTAETVFGLASLTKTFTAIVLLSLVESGRLDLSDTLDKYLSKLPKSYRKLTLRQLATMTAGVPRKAPQEVPWTQQIELLSQMPLVSDPGTSFLYSNYSYRLLGSVIEAVTGKSYFDMVAATVLDKCGMRMTGTTETLFPTGLLSTAYGPAGNAGVRRVVYKSPAVTFSAGMLASNLDDLILYVRALLAKRLLSPPSYQTMWLDRPPLPDGTPSNWAFGWGSTWSAGTLRIAMNGGTPGVASTIILLPERNSAVIALSNLRKKPVYAIARKVAGLVFETGATPSGPGLEPEPALEPGVEPGSEP